MARIEGVDLPKNKRGEIALTYIYGIGRSKAKLILIKAGVDCNIKVSEWEPNHVNNIRDVISQEKIGNFPLLFQRLKNN